jgi:hypothetical protein
MAKTKLTNMMDELISDTEKKPKGPFKPKVSNPNTETAETIFEEQEGEQITRAPSNKPENVTGTRDIEIGDKKYTLVRKDPYGFWYIQAASGRLPTELSGQFTDVASAVRAVTVYVNSL